MTATTLNALLRDPKEIARRCLEDDGIRDLVATALVCLVLGAGAFGAVLGTFRGELQILYGGVKLPLALLATLAVATPAFHVLCAAWGRPLPLRSVIALSLASAARAALVLMALAPILWLAIDSGLSYHRSAVFAAIVYGLSGLAALALLVRGLGVNPRGLMTTAAVAIVFLAVGGQTAWILRPYLGRPAQDEIPFVRTREGGFADAIGTSVGSSLGHYRGAPPSETAPPTDLSDVWDVPARRDSTMSEPGPEAEPQPEPSP